MAHKSIGGWIFADRMYLKIKVATKLWEFSRRDGTGESAVHLFFLGWYSMSGSGKKLFSVDILWLSIQVGF